MRILIKNIAGLVSATENAPQPKRGKTLSDLPIIKDAFLGIEDGKILSFGRMEDWGGITDWRDLTVIDAENSYVLPAWCDSHTHLVFGGTRESEFVDRISGLSYQEIAAKGGGILNSARKLTTFNEDDLVEKARERLNEILQTGTGAVEIKSGYGLTTESELKILRAIKRLKKESPLTIKSTFLGAHAYPAEFRENHQKYLDIIINEMIPAVAEEGLADFIDVFCETNYFSVPEMEQILNAGASVGLKPKVHVNQFTSIGGISSAIQHRAISVDHLEIMEPDDLEQLKASSTIATLLPSCSFFLNIPYAPARKLIENDAIVALASDYNPGSTPSGNIPFLLSLACIKLKMSPFEAINAATINGAFAMEEGENLGSITPGKVANLIISKPIPSLEYIPYAFGSRHIKTMILNGKIEWENT